MNFDINCGFENQSKIILSCQNLHYLVSVWDCVIEVCFYINSSADYHPPLVSHICWSSCPGGAVFDSLQDADTRGQLCMMECLHQANYSRRAEGRAWGPGNRTDPRVTTFPKPFDCSHITCSECSERGLHSLKSWFEIFNKEQVINSEAGAWGRF